MQLNLLKYIKVSTYSLHKSKASTVFGVVCCWKLSKFYHSKVCTITSNL